jgi:hypothetical protein
MKKEIIQIGVVAELNGKYWGIEYEDGQCTVYGFGSIENAKISDPEFCTKPEDLTYKDSCYYDILRQAKLVSVTKKIIYEVGDSNG